MLYFFRVGSTGISWFFCYTAERETTKRRDSLCFLTQELIAHHKWLARECSISAETDADDESNEILLNDLSYLLGCQNMVNAFSRLLITFAWPCSGHCCVTVPLFGKSLPTSSAIRLSTAELCCVEKWQKRGLPRERRSTREAGVRKGWLLTIYLFCHKNPERNTAHAQPAKKQLIPSHEQRWWDQCAKPFPAFPRWIRRQLSPAISKISIPQNCARWPCG